jgi:hypothetical protein
MFSQSSKTCPKQIRGVTINNKSKLFIIKLAYNPNIINVSLTYLRGLEIVELKEEDMPMVY